MLLRMQGKKTNNYDRRFKGEKRICAVTGFTGYEKDMVKVNGKWILREYVDKDETNDLSFLRR